MIHTASSDVHIQRRQIRARNIFRIVLLALLGVAAVISDSAGASSNPKTRVQAASEITGFESDLADPRMGGRRARNERAPQESKPAELRDGRDQHRELQPEVVITASRLDSGGLSSRRGKITGDGVEFINLITVAYQTSLHRVIDQVSPVEGKYKIRAVAPKGREDLIYQALQKEVEATFGIRVRRETREMDVSVLRAPSIYGSKLRRSRAGSPQHWFVDGKMHAEKQPVSTLTDVLETFLDRPVIDETGLEGEYDWEFSYRKSDETTVVNSVRDELGLEIAPARRAIEVLVVERVDED